MIEAIRLEGVVDPFTASYVKDGIANAVAAGDEAVLLSIDTPGGLDSSMRTITQAILNSSVPVICYTAPSGRTRRVGRDVRHVFVLFERHGARDEHRRGPSGRGQWRHRADEGDERRRGVHPLPR